MGHINEYLLQGPNPTAIINTTKKKLLDFHTVCDKRKFQNTTDLKSG
jgi:hypothetical protein